MPTQTGPCPDQLVRRRRTAPPLVRCLPVGRAGRGTRPARPALPAGDLRAPDAIAVRALVQAAERVGVDLVVDAGAVTSVDAAVVGVLLAADARLRLAGARVVLCGARPRVVRALHVAGAEGLLRR